MVDLLLLDVLMIVVKLFFGIVNDKCLKIRSFLFLLYENLILLKVIL